MVNSELVENQYFRINWNYALISTFSVGRSQTALASLYNPSSNNSDYYILIAVVFIQRTT
jgi:hypothetical protein